MTRPFAARWTVAATWLALTMLLWLTGCRPLPPLEGRSETRQLPVDQAQQTSLGELVSPLVAQHDGVNGFHALGNARDAFAARLVLAEAAEQTLDVQYYIWHDDTTGSLLYRALLNAADRGVRVRMLLDDTNTAGLDDKLAALDAHPSIEVRLFNPFVVRSPRFVGYLTDFSRANRRMHNKSFTADNQATIIGGRNIGDEYFGAATDVAFSDLDVLAIGPVVQDVSGDFDRYWASRSAYPASRLIDSVGREGTARLDAQVDRLAGEPEAQVFLQALEEEPLLRRLRERRLPLVWAEATMVSDDPAKGLGEVGDEALLIGRIRGLLGPPEEEVYLVSPYFVPVEKGTRLFIELEARGVEVTILTNALEATDVGAVHAGYAKYRRELLEAGVRLLELKRQPGAPGRSQAAGPFGSKGASLHAKTFAVDGARVFVGSFNFDPRSAALNTELGFVIESPELARRLIEVFHSGLLGNVYEVRLDEAGDLVWLERTDQGTLRHGSEPSVGLLRRAWVSFLSVLPIDWML